jgi:hypothetical protein
VPAIWNLTEEAFLLSCRSGLATRLTDPGLIALELSRSLRLTLFDVRQSPGAIFPIMSALKFVRSVRTTPIGKVMVYRIKRIGTGLGVFQGDLWS